LCIFAQIRYFPYIKFRAQSRFARLGSKFINVSGLRTSQ
jgi:hypothetical protein